MGLVVVRSERPSCFWNGFRVPRPFAGCWHHKLVVLLERYFGVPVFHVHDSIKFLHRSSTASLPSALKRPPRLEGIGGIGGGKVRVHSLRYRVQGTRKVPGGPLPEAWFGLALVSSSLFVGSLHDTRLFPGVSLKQKHREAQTKPRKSGTFPFGRLRAWGRA